MTEKAMTLPSVGISDLEVFADSLDVTQAAAIYKEYGALVVRGLMTPFVEAIRADIEAAAEQAIALLDQAVKIPEGWSTPDGTLWLPAPDGFERDKQIMIVPCKYTHSGAFFTSALHAPLLDIIEAILGPDIELFMNGQCLFKEPCGGHPKMLHQDASYFEHRFEGPCAVLSYAVDTDVQRGALHVVPGSHKLGVLSHVDTFSHLGLDPSIWTLEKAVPVEGIAGDAIFFHVNTIHGSPANHSTKSRPVFIHRYRSADDYVVVSATGTENRKLAEKRVEEAKKENQLGYLVRGRRAYDPAR
ncbi:MAG: phytanoyl-CoA dioxygenase family protein [Verrucomicrobia bacterium]|nr:phytanoyl-CoA dioxygenase family protein [Verrucomicrobiota bacterium]